MVLLQLISLVVCTSLLSIQPPMADAVISGSDVQGRLLNIGESSAVDYACLGCIICLPLYSCERLSFLHAVSH